MSSIISTRRLFDPALLYNLTLEGSKFTKLDKK